MDLEIRTLSDRLVDVVRDRILSGEIPPNVPIRQDALAAELRTSKIPLREALARLEQDGLLVSRAHRGFFVRPMSTDEAEEVFALRMQIEPPAAARACRSASAAQRETATAALAVLTAAAAARLPNVGALNRSFHLSLVQPGGQAVTTNVVRSLHIIADRYVRKHLEPQLRHLRAESEHEKILDAWLNADARRVKKLLHEHLARTLRDLRLQLSADQDKEEIPPAQSSRGTSKKSRTRGQDR